MPPPERMTLKTNLSFHRSSCHHHPTSLHRSMTLTTRRRLQKEHLLPLPSRTTSTRLEDLFSSTDSRGACAASPVRPSSSDALASQGASSRCSTTALLDSAVGKRGSWNPHGLEGYAWISVTLAPDKHFSSLFQRGSTPAFSGSRSRSPPGIIGGKSVFISFQTPQGRFGRQPVGLEEIRGGDAPPYVLFSTVQ